MQNEIDGRRGHREAEHQDPRYQDAPVDEYGPDEGEYVDDPQYADPRYADEAQYSDPYQGYEDEAAYQQHQPKRSRLVPILAIVAALLAVALGVLVVLYAIGFFDNNTTPGTQLAEDIADPIDLTPDAVPDVPDVREVTTDQPPPADTALDTALVDVPGPDVRDAAVAITPSEQTDPPVRSTHGDWQIRCDTPAGAQSEQCVLMQFVTAEDRDNVGLTVIVLKTADGEARLMRILAPLGVLLPNGLSLRIDDTDIGRAGFVRCLPNGCVAEVILEDPLLTQLGAGATATFIIFQTPEEGIGIPISLAGFSDGYAALPAPPVGSAAAEPTLPVAPAPVPAPQ